MKKLLNRYINGNYSVRIYEDGTKIRFTKDDEFKAEFPENIDLKITNYCPIGCPMCHEKSTTQGKHSDIVNEEFINSLVPGTELALGGGMVTSYPKLKELLIKLHDKGIIANITIHKDELLGKLDFIKELISQKLVYGIGVSISNVDVTDEFINLIKSLGNNIVLHVIAGITKMETFNKLANHNLKILILGYKTFGRGNDYFNKYNDSISREIELLNSNLNKLMYEFAVMSFDNLALEQLDVKHKVDQQTWDDFYMGEDGQHTMYIDAVERKFGRNSTSTIRYDLLNDIRDMFKVVKEENV